MKTWAMADGAGAGPLERADQSPAGAAVRAGSVVVRDAAEQVGHRTGRRRRRRFARQRLGLSSSRRRFPTARKPRRSILRKPSAAFRRRRSCSSAPSGKFLQAWGGPGQGYEWFTTEHGIFVDAPGQRLVERQREGGQPDPEVHEHGQVRDADRPLGEEQGQQRHREPRRTGRPVRVSEDQRALRRRRLLQPSRHRLRCGDRASTSVTGAPTASRPTTTTSSRRAPSSCKAPPAPQFHNPVHAVRRVERRSRLRRRSHQQSVPGVQARRHVRQGDLHRAEHAPGRRHRAPLRPVAGQGAAVPLPRRRIEQGRAHSESPDAGDRWRTSADTPDTTRASSSTSTAPPSTRRAISISARSTTGSATTATRSKAWDLLRHGDGSHTEATEHTEVTEPAGRRSDPSP